jgi:hypothetical protein
MTHYFFVIANTINMAHQQRPSIKGWSATATCNSGILFIFFGLLSLVLVQPSSSNEITDSLRAHTTLRPVMPINRFGNIDFIRDDTSIPKDDKSYRKLKDTEAEEEAAKEEEDRLKEEAKAQEEQLKDEEDAYEDILEAKQRQLWLVHGALMALSWGVLVPCAIGSSLLRAMIGGPLWFQIHQYTQMLAFLSTTAGFGIAVYNVQREVGGSPDEHFDEGHKAIGLSIFVILVVQMLSGIFRPHLPPPPGPPPSGNDHDVDGTENAEQVKNSNNNSNDPTATKSSLTSNSSGYDDNEIKQAIPEPTSKPHQKPMARRFFEVQHRVFGATLLVLAWINCTIGIQKVFDEDDYGSGGGGSTAVLSIFWAVAGGITVVVILLRLWIQLGCK